MKNREIIKIKVDKDSVMNKKLIYIYKNVLLWPE